MKLLLDQNLPPRLCDRLRDIWTDVAHVRAVGLAAADDSAIWAYASQHGFTIMSKDGDFSGRSSWLALGNCSTHQIEVHLRRHRGEIESFVAEPDTTLLVIEPDQDADAT